MVNVDLGLDLVPNYPAAERNALSSDPSLVMISEMKCICIKMLFLNYSG